MTDVIENVMVKDQHVEEETEKIRKLLAKVTQRNIFDTSIISKLHVVSAGDGRMTAELIIQPEHTNVYGTLHGGCIATIIDICTSIAMSTHSKPGNGVSVDLNISYMNPGKLNDTIVIEASTIKVGRTLGFAEAILKSKTTGAVIAKGSHTKHVENSEKYSITK